MNKVRFSELVPNTQAKFLITKGAYITRIIRDEQIVVLYSLGKRFYEITFDSYYYDEIVRIDEISYDNAMHGYFSNNG